MNSRGPYLMQRIVLHLFCVFFFIENIAYHIQNMIWIINYFSVKFPIHLFISYIANEILIELFKIVRSELYM